MPKTKLGKWSVGLILVMFLLFSAGMFFVNLYSDVPAGKTIPQDIVDRPGVALSMLAGFVCGIAALVSGAASIIRNKERSILVFIATIIGTLLLYLLIGEIIFPH